MRNRIFTERIYEQTYRWVGARPITFEQFLDLDFGDSYVELIDGTGAERPAVRIEHELLFNFLYRLLGDFAEERKLGLVLGSRTPVEIGPFRGRLPDIVFVRGDRAETVRQKAIYGPPDLVIEISSPSDRPSDRVALETDYCTIGVPEIWFLDSKRREGRVLRKSGSGYAEETVAGGILASTSVDGFAVPIEWLFTEPRPTIREALDRLLSGPV
jgi:Uma2 family endonuclease